MPLFVPKDRISLFRQFLAGMYDAVVITDPSGHILEVNARTEDHFGYAGDELPDQPVSFLIPGLSAEAVQRIRKALSDDRHVIVDANGRTKDGKKVACEVAVSTLDFRGPDDLVFTIRNVERRRAYLSALRARDAAFQISQTALFACGLDGAFLEANAAFRELFGLESDAEVRAHVFEDYMSDKPLPERFKKALAGEKTVTLIVAEGDAADEEELEIVLAPNWRGRKIVGVVGSILRS